MIYKIVTGTAMIVIGLFSELMGLLFAITYSGLTSRVIASGIFFSAGLPLLVFGFIIFKAGMVQRPTLVKKELLKTAAQNNGELTREIITGTSGWDNVVIYEINEMIKNKTIKEEERNGEIFYLFPKFQPKYIMNKCPYCGNDYPVRNDVLKCPTCKGDLKFLYAKS
jgi:hypothetical protein